MRFINASVTEDLINASGAALKACQDIYGADNCILINRFADGELVTNIDIGKGIANFKPNPNSDEFYTWNKSKDYNKLVAGKVRLYKGNSFEIEAKGGTSYFREMPNTFIIAPSIKKHIKDYIKL